MLSISQHTVARQIFERLAVRNFFEFVFKAFGYNHLKFEALFLRQLKFSLHRKLAPIFETKFLDMSRNQ